jgi:hypothetical protein
VTEKRPRAFPVSPKFPEQERIETFHFVAEKGREKLREKLWKLFFSLLDYFS